MVIVGSERGSASELAAHLLNDKDGNEHISIHSIEGFISDDLEGAFEESYAISRGSRCKNHLFSVSFNPPANEYVSIETFEDAIQRVEDINGLGGHSRAIVFHEKGGRKHAHVVWSRIDAETMTAKQLSHYKLKLQTISRELHHENNWQMPKGLARKGHGDPRNYTLAEYQQSKRMNVDPRDLKGAIQDAYNASDNAKSFANALSERGYILAKGNRRGHVAVSHEGEIISISRFVGKKAKEVREKLGDANDLQSVDEAKLQMTRDMRMAFIRHTKEAKSHQNQNQEQSNAEREALTNQHKAARQNLQEQQKSRWIEETKERSDRINSGLRGLWQWVTGQKAQIQRQNIEEAQKAQERDRQETNQLLEHQMQEGRKLTQRQNIIEQDHDQTLEQLREDRAKAREQHRELLEQFKQAREDAQNKAGIHKPNKQSPPSRDDGPEIER